MSDHTLVRRTRWDDSSADTSEWWELYEWRKNWLGKWAWRPVKAWQFSFGGDMYKERLSGDRAWADKVALHYGIQVPEAPKA